MQQIHTHYFRDIITIIIASIVALMLSMHLSLFMDESFTMSLIRHSYHSIINLDAMDVHPPLYYLILKLFLHFLTLGHQDIITDIILGRLFSFACFFTSFVIACMILNTMKLRYNKGILYILLISFMLWIQEVVSIRMYPLATLFVILEFYNIIQFIYHHRTRHMIFLTCFAALAAYTHDYAAVIAGLFILSAFVHDLLKRSSSTYQWFISGFIFFIVYLPWLKISINQALNLPSHYWILMINSLRDSLIFATFLLFAYPIIRSFQQIDFNHRFIYQLTLNVCIMVLIIELMLTIHQPVFILRYVCPLLFIYITLTYGYLSSLFIKTKEKDNHYTPIIIWLFLLIIGINVAYVNIQSQTQFHYQTMQLDRTFNTPTKHPYINIERTTQGNIRHLCQFNTYAQYQHKSLSQKENTSLFSNQKLKQGTSVKLMERVWR